MSEKKGGSAEYTPQKESIGALLSLTNPSILVPDWQRNYRWERTHIESFWTDIERFSERTAGNSGEEYFLGSVVLVDSDHLLLLDGQQRLATSAILLSAIRDKVKIFREQAGQQIQDQYLVGFDYLKDVVIHKLRLNIYDRDFFRRLVLDWRGSDYVQPTPTIASHTLLLQTREYFDKKLDALGQGKTEKEKYESYMALSRVLLDRVTLIAVYSTNEDSAADVFEALNDRGIGLSTPDLLRNLVMRRAKTGQLEEIVQLWESVVTFESDAKIENFLRHFWVSRYGDVKSRSLYREIKAEIEDKEIDSKKLAQLLSDSAENYRKILDSDTEYVEANALISEVLEFGRSSQILLPVILGIIEVLDETSATNCIGKLLHLFVRFAVISQFENSRLENIVYDAVRELRSTGDAEKFVQTLQKAAPSDDEIQERFRRLSIPHNGTRKNILRRIEMHYRPTEELEVANSKKVHVEHVYPQTPLPDERWEAHEKLINRIGNLTLLSSSINQSLKNKKFSEKKVRFGESDILITKALSKLEEWSPDAVDARQDQFAEIAPSLWSMD